MNLEEICASFIDWSCFFFFFVCLCCAMLCLAFLTCRAIMMTTCLGRRVPYFYFQVIFLLCFRTCTVGG
ncbi:uncharacterized protein GGS25DRAFT_468489 [Hypoxylon fragiforme]|uniref:uncharacterized protein n=1 Tax=Hypoxylon fragiforme TaxID=63214 RepID=UPI0020C68A53|nr:uncharacterized protein GGS25DRAFT_468489 [Hypoxylon fragiforme]KAI2613700.1 hypothetical protein GGS25DRAFT_468489 [Hypoxylon fragiforme]